MLIPGFCRFRWVQLQLDTFFNAKSPLRHSKDVKRKLDMLDKEVGVPQLGPVYDEIYDMNTQQPEDRRIAARTLKWVLCSQRPLRTDELVEAASMDLEGNVDEEVDGSYILEVCSNLIIADHNSFIQFSHLSVREYLVNRGVHIKEYSDIEAHTQAAETCLAYMLHTDIGGVTNFTEGGGFRGYAVLYWPVHCRMASKTRRTEGSLRRLFSVFMSTDEVNPSFIEWMSLIPTAAKTLYGKDGPLRREIEDTICSPPSPVFTAYVWGFSEVIHDSSRTGSSLEARNERGRPGLNVASQYGHVDIARLLLKNWTDIDAKDTLYGYTALHAAAQYGHLELMRLLVEKGANVAKKADGNINRGWTALHFAAWHGPEAAVRLLLEKGADVNAKESGGWTALHLAASSGQAAVVRLLMENAADVDAKTNARETALQRAAGTGQEEVVRLMLEHLGGESSSEEWLRTAQLHNAVHSGDETTVRLLLETGADVTAKDNRGGAALHWAAANGHKEVVCLLLERGEDVEATDKFGMTALLMAAQRGDEAMMQFLLEKGAGIEAKDDSGRTALYWATAEGHLVAVVLLLEKGANPGSVDVDTIEFWGDVAQADFEAAVQAIRDWKGVTSLLTTGGPD